MLPIETLRSPYWPELTTLASMVWFTMSFNFILFMYHLSFTGELKVAGQTIGLPGGLPFRHQSTCVASAAFRPFLGPDSREGSFIC